jgi:UDP-N-acetylglucosamine:LPS N-acetylglucosamine transferase
MGLVVAEKAGIPSVLVENFTWDWIYSDYQLESKQFEPYIDYMRTCFRLATYHIKTKPFCQNDNSDLIVAPVSRKPRSLPSAVRTRLGLGQKEKIVLLTMGGISDTADYADGLANFSHIHFVIPGKNRKVPQRRNITFLPFLSDFFHPDLINAADAVIGKVGYSTVAEVYQAGKPFGYVSRPTFRESSVLEAFILDNLPCVSILNEELNNNSWVKKINTLIGMPIAIQRRENGADAIAEFVLARLQ